MNTSFSTLRALTVTAAFAAGLLAAGAAHAGRREYGSIEAEVDRGGKVTSCRLLDSSGDKSLDERALRECKDRSFPDALPGMSPDQASYTVILPVRPTESKR